MLFQQRELVGVRIVQSPQYRFMLFDRTQPEGRLAVRAQAKPIRQGELLRRHHRICLPHILVVRYPDAADRLSRPSMAGLAQSGCGRNPAPRGNPF